MHGQPHIRFAYLNGVRHEASRQFKNKKRDYLKAKMMNLKLTVQSKISDLHMGINNLNKGYVPVTNIIKDEKGQWVTDSHSILATWRNHFSQLLKVYGVNDVRQTEIHTAVTSA